MFRKFHVSLAVAALFATSYAMGAETAPAPATAGAPAYSVLSLIGDQLDIVFHEIETGKTVDPNSHKRVPIDDPMFDDAAVRAAANAIRKVSPEARVSALNTRSRVLFERQDSLFPVEAEIMSLPEPIKEVLRQQQATRLVLIGKQRGVPRISYSRGVYEGIGRLEGLGFYIDKAWSNFTYDKTTGVIGGTGKGFVAPFAYLQVTLVEVPSGRVLGRHKLSAASMVSSEKAEADDPWSALTPERKVAIVKGLIERELTPAITELVSSASK